MAKPRTWRQTGVIVLVLVLGTLSVPVFAQDEG